METVDEYKACPRSRHRRRLCGHCNELLSYSAYRSHRALYYIEPEDRWQVCGEENVTCPTECDNFMGIEELEDRDTLNSSFTGENIMLSFNPFKPHKCIIAELISVTTLP